MGIPQPGKFGDVSFSFEILSNRFLIKYNYSVTQKTSGFPSIQSHGDPLMNISLGIRLNSEYNIKPNNPIQLLEKFLSMASLSNGEARKNGFPFTFASKNWGNFVIESIDFNFVQMIDSGEPEIIDINMKLLQVN